MTPDTSIATSMPRMFGTSAWSSWRPEMIKAKLFGGLVGPSVGYYDDYDYDDDFY